MPEKPTFFKKSVKDLGFGTYDSIHTATMDTPLIEVLDLMTKFRITVVPIVDAHGCSPFPSLLTPHKFPNCLLFLLFFLFFRITP